MVDLSVKHKAINLLKDNIGNKLWPWFMQRFFSHRIKQNKENETWTIKENW